MTDDLIDGLRLNPTLEEFNTIRAIVARALGTSDVLATDIDRLGLLLDITALHCNSCPLRLGELLAADEFNFQHDIVGIARNLDRRTATLRNTFQPRFAKTTTH